MPLNIKSVVLAFSGVGGENILDDRLSSASQIASTWIAQEASAKRETHMVADRSPL